MTIEFIMNHQDAINIWTRRRKVELFLLLKTWSHSRTIIQPLKPAHLLKGISNMAEVMEPCLRLLPIYGEEVMTCMWTFWGRRIQDCKISSGLVCSLVSCVFMSSMNPEIPESRSPDRLLQSPEEMKGKFILLHFCLFSTLIQIFGTGLLTLGLRPLLAVCLGRRGRLEPPRGLMFLPRHRSTFTSLCSLE